MKINVILIVIMLNVIMVIVMAPSFKLSPIFSNFLSPSSAQPPLRWIYMGDFAVVQKRKQKRKQPLALACLGDGKTFFCIFC
jgi:hypothetical protein